MNMNTQSSAPASNLNMAAETTENSEKTQTTPAGMKILSGLIQQQSQDSHPFPDGGALPPKESEQNQNTQDSFSGNFNSSEYYEPGASASVLPKPLQFPEQH